MILAGSWRALAIPLVVVWGVGFGMQPIVTQSWMFDAAPGQMEGVQALFVSAAQASIGSGALVGGLVFDHVGLKAAFAVAAGTAFVTAAMFASRRST